MKTNSRTVNTVYNFISSIGGQLITVVMQFIVRNVFIMTLGKSYLGINGLFSNILTMLSLAEFGVGSAVLYKLYEPIAENNHRRIVVLMKFYKKVYRIIGIAVAVIGLCLLPFLPYLIEDYDKIQSLNINVAFIFLLYLFKTVSSYLFFAYKSAIIKANQKEYLINIIHYFFIIGIGIIQIICLLLHPNFELYVLISILEVVFQNIIYARLSDRMYPYINQDNDDKLEFSEVKEIFKDCSALFLYKLNTVVLKGTDNILLSTFLGLDAVALYSNYYIFYSTINSISNKVFNSVSHSLGNLHAVKNDKREYEVFEIINLITAILGGTACIGIFIVSDEFVATWIGTDWIIPQPFSLLMGIEIFTATSRIALGKYRSTMGLFQQGKYRPLIGMFVNLLVSVMLVKNWGVCGILVGTIVADWTTFMWYDPWLIHKYGFKKQKEVMVYFKKLLKYIFIISVVAVLDRYICKYFFVDLGWISVCVHAFICLITVPMALILSCLKEQEGQYICQLMIKCIRKIYKRKIRLKK